jgi:hypothetical protein
MTKIYRNLGAFFEKLYYQLRIVYNKNKTPDLALKTKTMDI